ncbi:MAG: energy-coupling factor ABC transporter ATP-binding protein [Desulfobacterales bacterium]|jgi:biotin transport system ATP-binding protein|nr:energy-coupling factor ABC transporter ATP-binding protein [Desulfobacterales bacterium]
MRPPIIEIENLVHRFPDGTLGLDGITLAIAEGAFVVLAGANGSGKTTLLRHLNGLLTPTTGSVRVAGLPVGTNLVRARQMVGMIFQDAESQIIGETVHADVAFGPENLRLPPAEVERRVRAALAAVALDAAPDRRPHLLSGGEKRRLSIAGVLAMDPKVLVFDEPFSNLDYPGVRQVLGQMTALHREGRTLVVTTHDLDKVLGHADRLVLLARGRVAADGSPAVVAERAEACGVRRPALASGRLSWLN